MGTPNLLAIMSGGPQVRRIWAAISVGVERPFLAAHCLEQHVRLREEESLA